VTKKKQPPAHQLTNLPANQLNSSPARLWTDLKESIAGTEQDFTSGKLGRAIFLLSVPMALEMMMESVFAIVDIFFVSKLGSDAVAAVGLTETMMTLIYALAVGLSTATSSMISRRIGEKNPEGASVVAFQAIITGICISVAIAIPGVIFSRGLLKLMGASDIAVSELWGYTAVMMGGNMVIMLLFIINAIFRSAGDAAISMRVLWIANIINIILDPLLIFGIGPFPELGVMGAAVATTTGRGLAVVLQLYFLFSGKKRVTLKSHHIRFNHLIMGRLIKLSLGGIGQHIIATSSWIILIRIISVFGSTVVAGYTLAIRVMVFALLPAWGMSNAASTLVGQNLGAGQPARAERSVWITGWSNTIFMGIVGLILVTWSKFFIRLFIDDPEVVRAGAICLRFISIGFIAYGLGMVLVNALNGAGDTFTPTMINIFCYWILEIPLAWYLAIHSGMNETGVYISIVVAETIMTVSALVVFKGGKWKEKRV
jgi:putative MATE family efflux protein